MHGKKNGALGSIGPLGPRFFLGGGKRIKTIIVMDGDVTRKKNEMRRDEMRFGDYYIPSYMDSPGFLVLVFGFWFFFFPFKKT